MNGHVEYVIVASASGYLAVSRNLKLQSIFSIQKFLEAIALRASITRIFRVWSKSVLMLAASRLCTPFPCVLHPWKLVTWQRGPYFKFPARRPPCTSKIGNNLNTEPRFLRRMEQLWSRGWTDKNSSLVEHLQQHGVIKSTRVADVLEKIDRGLFVPEGNPPYVDTPMPIGYNATISAPHMHATCLELLEQHMQPGMHALDVGSGTGYLTACFAMMVGPHGRAVGVEHIPELVVMSIENVKKSKANALLADGSLSLYVGDGRQGWPELAPYDAIHVGAAAPEVPCALIEQLKPGGRMVIPVGNFFQDLQVIDKQLDGSVKVHSVTSVRYVPLTSRQEQLGGY